MMNIEIGSFKLKTLRFGFYGILILAILTGVFLRFYHIQERGLFYFDEGLYLSEARFVREGVDLVLHKASIFAPGFDLEGLKSQTQGVPLVTGKPGYVFILFLFGLIAGPGDRSLFLTSAIFGVFNLMLIYRIAGTLYNRNVALLSLSIAAISSYHLFYSTVGLPEMVGLTLYLAGFLFFYMSTKKLGHLRYIFFSGISIGYAFTCNQWRWILMPLFILIFESLFFVNGKLLFKVYLKRVAVFVSSFAIPLVIFQVPYQVLSLFKGELPFKTYFQQLGERVTHGSAMVLSLRENAIFIKYLWRVEGGFFTLILFTGFLFLLVAALKRRKEEDVYLLTVFFVPLLIFSFFKYHGYVLSRTISMIVPFSAIVIARPFQRIRSSALICLLAGVILCAGSIHSFPILRTSSGYRQAARYLQEKGLKKVFILDNEPVFRFYAGRIAYLPYQRPGSFSELLRESRAAGAGRVVVDFNVLYSKYGMSYAGELVNSLEPEVAFPNFCSGLFVRLAEVYPYETIKKILSDPRSRYIEVYDLSKYRPGTKI